MKNLFVFSKIFKDTVVSTAKLIRVPYTSFFVPYKRPNGKLLAKPNASQRKNLIVFSKIFKDTVVSTAKVIREKNPR